MDFYFILGWTLVILCPICFFILLLYIELHPICYLFWGLILIHAITRNDFFLILAGLCIPLRVYFEDGGFKK
jgi:hypothetical protein